MKGSLPLSVALAVAVAGLVLAGSEEGPTRPKAPAGARNHKQADAPAGRETPVPEPEPIELSGRLLRPVKWTPQLELLPAGQTRSIDLQGALLEGLDAGTFIRVRGVARSRLHRGGTKENPSPFPAQWILWLEVTDVEVLSDPLDVLKETSADE